MESATPTTISQSPRPMNQPHTPISMDEMNPNIHNESPSSAKATLLNIASLLVLLGVIGITIWLYMQNKTAQTAIKKESTKADSIHEVTTTETPRAQNLSKEYGNVVCARFTSVDEALLNPNIACTLDLSNQNLTSIPSNIVQLPKLKELDASHNNIVIFPKSLTLMKELTNINLSDNEIEDIPSEIMNMSSLQSLTISNNKISSFPADEKTINNTSLVTIDLDGNPIPTDQIKILKRLLPLK
ncbi:MAG: leucine-rich repeat domain-containing protein [Candidatus Moraniibacteriota bacterium]|nr:MAG: leucine-rich repeat domain-containing protein [Candidatus Moranbacteria bacterium]